MSKKKITDLVKILRYHKDQYYNGTAELTDIEFDSLEEELKSIDPYNEYFDEVGSPSSGEIIHKIPMLSMGKTKDINGISKWYSSVGLSPHTEMIIEPKIDGLSITVKYDINGRLMYVATRGNGVLGKRVKFGHLIEGIPNKIPKRFGSIEVRGEVYIRKSYGKKYKILKDVSLRNVASGIISQKVKSSDLEYLSFIAYDIVPPGPMFKKVSNILITLEKLGFHVIETVSVNNIENIAKYVSKYLMSLRTKWDYTTDGLVITVNDITKYPEIDNQKIVKHHHHYNLAIKPPAEGGITTIENIEWNVSRFGRIKPVGIIQPLPIGNVVYTRATLNNRANVINLDLAPGDKIHVERANDVIPKITHVVRRRPRPNNGKFKIPTKCPSCNSKPLRKDGVDLICDNFYCKGRIMDKIYQWAKGMEIKNVGERVVSDLYENEIVRSIAELYRSDLGDSLGVLPGYVAGGSKIKKIVENISISKRKTTELDIISNIGIPSVGRITLLKLGVHSIDELVNLKKLTHLHNLAVVRSILDWLSIKENFNELEELKEVIKPKKFKKPKKMKKVCITGKFKKSRSELIRELASKGYTTVNSVTSDIIFLLAGEDSENTSKMFKAKKLNIEIRTKI